MSTGRWKRYDRRGFSVACCEDDKGRWHWQVYHPKYGRRWGKELSWGACHLAVNWAIGDMRQGIEATG